ncbi:hypothetical protein TBLA_0C05730 [Henningerozyma blattae CBS 6284]|uniref:Protein LST4 n=1 Tax=Henningerozyma blattae (strain ATCC 34711 / CBS 6284 / DSM 70876 / NBRC 10599 / NRRL Y-10934 / UCD 77-7) TaxID=1071380 RepID=I2H1W9_HENB6|nr:hypothetical protein TBLA_0C05730 [Tetrapisispora blattae CBS 6284]CCH60371.1 hypothetical protein TBLA_0C05730 [Tetrapisispora blattae CBS 6284]
MLAHLLRKSPNSSLINPSNNSNNSNISSNSNFSTHYTNNSNNQASNLYSGSLHAKFHSNANVDTSSVNFNTTDTNIPKVYAQNHMLDHMYDDLKFKLFGTNTLKDKNDRICNIQTENKEKPTMTNPPSLIRRTSSSLSLSNERFQDGFGVFIVEETAKRMSRCSYRIAMEYVSIKGTAIQKIRPNELKEYIFGSPIRLSNSTQTTKIRFIPTSGLIMVTRLFYFEAGSNRLAICFCVPKKYLVAICEVWKQVSLWFDRIQDIIINLIKNRGANNNYRSFVLSPCGGNNGDNSEILLPVDIRNQYPVEAERIITCLKKMLIPNIESIYITPRLFMYPTTSKGFVESWFIDVFNWLEIKDGNKMGFLTVLMAKIMMDFRDLLKKSDVTRIVILSGNPVVANKLIFILSGLLGPKYKGRVEFDTMGNSNLLSIGHKKKPYNFKDHLPNTNNTNYNHNNNNNHNHNNANNASFDSINNMRQPSETGTVTSSEEASNATVEQFPSLTMHSTSKGWEIPKKRGTTNLASISSNEFLGDVIQPSSFKSGSSSLHHLFSSISSQTGSHGSWFSKRPTISQHMQHTPSTISSGSYDRLPSLFRSSSNTSIFGGQGSGQGRTFSNLSSSFATTALASFSTPQQSPSISEYDDYPWFGTPSTNNSNTNNTELFSYNNGSLSYKKNSKYNFPMVNLQLERNYQRLSQESILDEAFDRISKDTTMELIDTVDNQNDSSTDYKITMGNENHASVLEVPMRDLDDDKNEESILEGISDTEQLPRYTIFQPYYNGLFQLQACPQGSESEHKVTLSMKQELYNHSEVHTLLVLPGTREIKEVIMSKKSLTENGKSKICTNDSNTDLESLISPNSTERVILRTKRIFGNGRIISNNGITPTTNLASTAITPDTTGGLLVDYATLIEDILKQANDIFMSTSTSNILSTNNTNNDNNNNITSINNLASTAPATAASTANNTTVQDIGPITGSSVVATSMASPHFTQNSTTATIAGPIARDDISSIRDDLSSLKDDIPNTRDDTPSASNDTCNVEPMNRGLQLQALFTKLLNPELSLPNPIPT